MAAESTIPINDLSRAISRDRDAMLEAVARVLDSGDLIHGPEHAAFESELAAFLGTDEAVGVASGTDALELALRAAMPVGRRTVLTAANAGGYTSVAARRAGFNLSFADVDAATLCVSAATIGDAITAGVGVVVVTHLYGRMTDIREIVNIAHAHGALVVEDVAQAIGARMDGRSAGAVADLGTISFYPTKNLGALGDGGAVVSSHTELANAVRTLRQYGWSSKYRIDLPGGANSRLDELQAAFLRIRLREVDTLNSRRRAIVRHYREAAAGLDPRVLSVLDADGEEHVAHLAVARSGDRDGVRNRLADAGIRTDVHFPVPDHLQPGLAVGPVALPVTEKACAEVLTLPCFPELRDDEVERVGEAIRRLG